MTCPRCNKTFQPHDKRQKYCGSFLEETGCAYLMRKNKGHLKRVDRREVVAYVGKSYQDYVRESKIREGWADDKAARFARSAEKSRLLENWESKNLRGLETWSKNRYRPSQNAQEAL